jgi:hypothetical protein
MTRVARCYSQSLQRHSFGDMFPGIYCTKFRTTAALLDTHKELRRQERGPQHFQQKKPGHAIDRPHANLILPIHDDASRDSCAFPVMDRVESQC